MLHLFINMYNLYLQSIESVSDKVSEGISNFVEKLLPSNEGALQSAQMSFLGEGLPQYKPLTIDRTVPECEIEAEASMPSCVPTAPVLPRIKPKTSVYKPGRPGGGWDDSEDEEETVNDPVVETISKQSSESVDSIDFSKIELKEVSADWTDERKVIEEFTVNEELNKLDYDNIASVCKRCSSLNCDKILSFLIEKLSEHEELVLLRALIFIEYLIFHDILTIESLLKIVSPPLTLLGEKEDGFPVSVIIKAKKISRIISKLSKISQQQHPKQLVEMSEKR